MHGLTIQNGDNMVGMATMFDPHLTYASENPKATVNQSRHEKTVRLARLAMLVECEGSITIGMSPPTKTRNRPSLYPTVDITNTAEEIIDEARVTLASEGVGFSVKSARHSRSLGKKLRHDINIHAFDRVESVLTEDAAVPSLEKAAGRVGS